MSEWRWHERYSFGWLRALAACARFNVSEWEVDDGIDATLQRIKPYAQLHVQLKTVTHDDYILTDGSMSFPLSGKRIHNLTADPSSFGLLVVIRLPRHHEEWMDTSEGLVLGSRSWWGVVEDSVTVADIADDDATHVVNMTEDRRLTPEVLIEQAERAKEVTA